MDSIIAFFHQLYDPIKTTLMNPDWIMAHGGLYLVAFIIFAETGLLVGFFLPGDSLLFITGIVIAGSKNTPVPFDNHIVNLIFWIILLTVAGVIGNFVGYWFGKKTGPLLFERKDTWLIKKKHIQQAHEFYDKKGGVAVIFARFLPIVRTFAPIVAGVVKMDFKKFALYNIVGAILWIASLVSLGFVLGENEWVERNLELIIIALVLVTTGPVLFKMFFGKKKQPDQKVNEPDEMAV
ncbi:DedA family protein [Taibaiella chishuiensis]|uniref:Membrane-associated protein n=1 Tax=Taibaiella chishuiensis TaxID=1434707 RepID=A0A2P8D851_9BACT|nr:VTT domain-containing protein [Taibaiella chishuiensis]PSK93392.1 membrane-associated protein [Taibaiella chishuiensis]